MDPTDASGRQSESELLEYLAAGGRLTSPDNAPPRYRAELMRLMAVFVDSELAGASGFADCINLAPGLEERISAAQVVLEKFGAASQVLQLMEPFGANTRQYIAAHAWAARLDRSADLGTRRIDGDLRLNVFHYPIHGWVDAVTMNFLMGRASVIQLKEMSASSYQPFADALSDIVPVELRHADLGERELGRALSSGYDKVAAQASVNYWMPRVAATFGRLASERTDTYRTFGLRRHANEELLSEWRQGIAPALAALRLSVD